MWVRERERERETRRERDREGVRQGGLGERDSEAGRGRKKETEMVEGRREIAEKRKKEGVWQG